MSNLSDGTMHPVEQADAQTAAQPVKLATVPSSPMAEGAHEPLDAAAADARAVLETWKAANPWWRTVILLTVSCSHETSCMIRLDTWMMCFAASCWAVA